MFRYETHLHTSPASRCGKATVEETVRFYHAQGYTGIFLTNHYLCGNIGIDKACPFEEKLAFYFRDFHEAKTLGDTLGLQVLLGVEITDGGSDVLVYGLSEDWWAAHPEILSMTMRQRLTLMREEGAFLVHAHPFREAGYIDHLRLWPRNVDAVEVYNACRTDFENAMAAQYAQNYGLIPVAGSDNHVGVHRDMLGGMVFDRPLTDESDYGTLVREGAYRWFRSPNMSFEP